MIIIAVVFACPYLPHNLPCAASLPAGLDVSLFVLSLSVSVCVVVCERVRMN